MHDILPWWFWSEVSSHLRYWWLFLRPLGPRNSQIHSLGSALQSQEQKIHKGWHFIENEKWLLNTNTDNVWQQNMDKTAFYESLVNGIDAVLIKKKKKMSKIQLSSQSLFLIWQSMKNTRGHKPISNHLFGLQPIVISLTNSLTKMA